MGTKKGQVRKTARRAYEPKKTRFQIRLFHATQASKATGIPAYKWMKNYRKWSGK